MLLLLHLQGRRLLRGTTEILRSPVPRQQVIDEYEIMKGSIARTENKIHIDK